MITTTTDNRDVRNKRTLDEQTLALKMTMAQALAVVAALPLVSFYSGDSWWGLLLGMLRSAFYLPDLAVSFADFFTWPRFTLPGFNFQFSLAVVAVSLAVLVKLLRDALRWMYTQRWFAMRSATPSRWEDRVMSTFAWLRCVCGGAWRWDWGSSVFGDGLGACGGMG